MMLRHCHRAIKRHIVIMMLRHCRHAIERHNIIVTAHVELYFFQILVSCHFFIDCFIQSCTIVMKI